MLSSDGFGLGKVKGRGEEVVGIYDAQYSAVCWKRFILEL